MQPHPPPESCGTHSPVAADASTGQSHTRTRQILWGSATLVLVAAVLCLGLPDRLIWDDLVLIGGMTSQPSAASMVDVFTGDFFRRGVDASELHYYRPLVQLSYLAGAALWGAAPYGYALSNLAFHLLACGLLFALLVRFGTTPAAAAAGTALFGLMPRLTESVFWISGRTDILASVFVLAALLAYGAYDPRLDRPGRRLAGSALLFLGLLCKEVAVAGLAALVLFEMVPAYHARLARPADGDRGTLRGLAIRLAPLFLALLAYLVIRVVALDGSTWRTSLSLSVWERVNLAGEALGRYVWMLADPLHPALRIGSLFAPRSVLLTALGGGTAVVGVAGVVAAARLNRPSGVLVGLALAGASIALVLHLVPMGSDAIAADRFLYLPVIGLVIAASIAASQLPRGGRQVAGGLAAIVVVAFSLACIERAEQWSDDVRLWHHTVLHADDHDALPHAWLGIALLDRGEPAAALIHFGRAFRIETAKPPEYRKSTLILEQLANSSMALSALGRDADALHAIGQAISLRKGHAPYLEQRARVLARMLRFDDALAAVAAARAAGGDARRLDGLADEIAGLGTLHRSLPEPRADEPIAVRIERARIYGQLGANVAAEAIWRDVTSGHEISDDILLTAAAFYTFRGDATRAQTLIDRAAQSSAHRAQTEQLAAALAQRIRSAVPTEILTYTAELDSRS